MKHFFASIALTCFLSISGIAQISSPESYLPNFGKTVTYYHQVEDYFRHLTQNSSQIQHYQYGVTPQERALHVYFISSDENLKNLETLRKNHLHEIGLYPTKDASIADKNILWLSFNV
ncbi:MAG: hypothetical protein ACK4FS_09030, partial [Flavobacterium sp.]